MRMEVAFVLLHFGYNYILHACSVSFLFLCYIDAGMIICYDYHFGNSCITVILMDCTINVLYILDCMCVVILSVSGIIQAIARCIGS